MRKRVRISRLLIWPLALVCLMTGSRWEGHPVFAGLLFCAACILVAVATAGRLWCALFVGGYKTAQLVTSGPYSLCRNPLYFCSAAGALGVGLATKTITVPLLLALMYALSYPRVIRSEEAFLGNLHGEAFNAYMAGVPRFWPSMRGWSESGEYLVAPAKFRQAMGDALWFMGLVGIIGLAEALRSAGIVPTLVRLY